MLVDFEAFQKIPRFSAGVVVTEKLDGTNAQVYIEEVTSYSVLDESKLLACVPGPNFGDSSRAIYAGSRNRWVTTQDDNYGFARWVVANAEELVKLGPGRHFGEWWGNGIQRGYGLKEKHFSLFNVRRWIDDPKLPDCCYLVPVVQEGGFEAVTEAMRLLAEYGSMASPGYGNPEGVIIYHRGSRQIYKKTFEYDQKGKSAALVSNGAES